LRISVLAMVGVMVACQSRNQFTPGGPPSTATNPTSNPVLAPATSNRPTDHWLGQWNGPEGTYLLLSANADKYIVKIQSLDGPATYEGVPVGDRIEFVRAGRTEFIRAGSGEETGMKWLLEKKNCLIVKTGEGFCRD
jgi:hypothetical protein